LGDVIKTHLQGSRIPEDIVVRQQETHNKMLRPEKARGVREMDTGKWKRSSKVMRADLHTHEHSGLFQVDFPFSFRDTIHSFPLFQ